MTKREPLMDQQYFDNEVEYDAKTIDRFEQKLAASTAPPPNRANFAYSVFGKRYRFLVLRYSRGEAISEIKTAFPATVESWERYLGMEGHEEYALDKDISDYVRALWLTSLAIIFEVDNDIFGRFQRCIGEPGQDSLLERLVATRIPARPDPKRLVWPTPYQSLYDAIDASDAARPTLFERFLKSWYPALGKLDAYWHDNHKGKDGGGFFGYWCIEAAGVVSAFGFDDSQFRDMQYYPKDLAVRRSTSL